MEATTLILVTGATRTVVGRAAEVGAALRERTLGGDDGLRTFRTVEGEDITVARGAVVLAEAAGAEVERAAFGFAAALEESA